MTPEWLIRALAVGALLWVAALAAERVAGWLGRPRRRVWAAAMAGSLLLPLLALAVPGALPAFDIPALHRPPAAAPAVPASPAVPIQPVSAVGEVTAEEPNPLPRVLGLAWLAASLAMLGCLAWSYWRMEALRDGCHAARVDGVRVLVSKRDGPLVLGVIHPEVLLPRWVLDAPAEERRWIVCHEREHVAAGDARLLALAAVAVALMPWNPALWAQRRRLHLAVETDCDARVLARGAAPGLYGRVLLRSAGQSFAFAGPAPAWGGRSSHLEQRIIAMTSRRPTRLLPRALSLALLAVAVAVTACSVAGGGSAARAPVAAAPAAVKPAPEGAIIVETHDDGQETAWREWDGIGIMIARREVDTTFGWVGITPSYKERRHEIRDGQRVMRTVETHPVVVGVDAGSPAEQAGIRVGDVLLMEDGRDARQPPTAILRPGDEITYRVRRDGRELDVRMVAVPAPKQVWPPTEADFEAARRTMEFAESSQP